ncbi:MAG: glycosyltransferase family 1 protein [Bacteroidota bacterium]
MSQIRLALFTGNYNHIKDGVSLTLNRWVQFLEEHGVEVLVFAPSIDEPVLKHAGNLVVSPSIPMPVQGRGEYRFTTGLPPRIQNILEEYNPNLLHLATPDRLGFKALKWALTNRVQTVASYHTHFFSYLKYYGLDFIGFFGMRYLAWFYGKCCHTYVPSQSMIEELQRFGIQADFRIWTRGVNNTLFSPEKRSEEWRSSIGFKEDDIVVTFVSRLVWEKELETYIESVKRVAAINPRVKALVVGEGPAMEELKQRLPDAHYAGFLVGEELARAYASSDVFLFPSHTETFGNVTLEAMASGLPCLVADAIGSKSLVQDGVNGKLGTIQDIDHFTKQLEFLVHDDERRTEMSRKSREIALTYNWETINEGLLTNYKEAIASPLPQPRF